MREKTVNDPSLFQRPLAKISEWVLEELQAKGLVLIVHGGPHDSEASILCDIGDTAEMIGLLRTALARLENVEDPDAN